MASRLSPDPEPVRPRPWYADGLRFQCRPDCGACCSDHGDYAYLYLEEGDVERLARFLGWDPERFRDRHTALDDGRPVLALNGPDCPFLRGTRCAVYPVRPIQCRTFPFWRENLRSHEEWERLSQFCPGIDAGEHHDLETIRRDIDARKPWSAPAARESS
jgi:hypothetical protein